MRKVLLLFQIFCLGMPCFASHIVGGEMFYEYVGPGATANTKSYKITLRLFRDNGCISCASMPTDVWIGIYNLDNNTEFAACSDGYCDVFKASEEVVAINPYPPCVVDAPLLNYSVGSYINTVDLPDNVNGYSVAYQTCCRFNPIQNVYNISGTGGTGSTYSCVIPPVIDNCPQFVTNVSLVCQKRAFTFDFSATDPDADSLVYYFCDAGDGGQAQNSNNVNPLAPPYTSVVYINGYSSSAPLGNLVTINGKTGIISGIAPEAGKYVVGVCVNSYRKGVYIGVHKKDFIVNVGSCDFAGAQLNPKPVTCDGFTVQFSDDISSPLNKTFFWDFGVPGLSNDTSNLPAPGYTYRDTGIYVYTLVINKGQPCADSAKQTVRVYPGFYPGFTVAGNCKNIPIQFTDTTKSIYAPVTAWNWNYEDPATLADTSHKQNPTYVYTTEGNYTAQLIVSNAKGCIDTVYKPVSIGSKPDFSLTNDTLICTIDTLQLNARGTGTIFWTPNYNINNQRSFSPLVSPDVPTKYYATLSDSYGCSGTDSVMVDVVGKVTLHTRADTLICKTDNITLNTIGNALSYLWIPASFLNYDSIKNPIATPLTTTTYSVTGIIGKCKSTDVVTIKIVPYPAAFAGNDTTICFGDFDQLHATGGSSYTWSPTVFLNNPAIPDPVSAPEQSIRYVVTVGDTLGCPKLVKDSILIIVENIKANAGPRDTSVVRNQPLQLNGTGGQFSLWTPSTGLNNPSVYNPVATLNSNITYVLTVSTAAGCMATDTISVTVYDVPPGLYVPNAFTPNGDGINDVFRPIPIGMKEITKFEVFNRWGVMMFSTTRKMQGWDGVYNGKAQDAAVYVWIVEGVDYQDKKIKQKGTVVLIR